MTQVLQPVNISGSLLIVQVFLLIIITLGLFFNRRISEFNKSHFNLYVVIWFAILSIIFVAFTADYYPVWSPILGDISLPTIERKYAFRFIFGMDLLVMAILILNTGGSNVSPFTSMLFLLPSLAIFLREPPAMFITYSVVAFLIFYFTFSIKKRSLIGADDDKPVSDLSHKFVSGACLALGVIIGYITRPVLTQM